MPSLLAGMPSSNILFRNLSKPAIWSSFAGPYWRMMSRLSIFVSIADLAMVIECGSMHSRRRVHKSLRRVSRQEVWRNSWYSSRGSHAYSGLHSSCHTCSYNAKIFQRVVDSQHLVLILMQGQQCSVIVQCLNCTSISARPTDTTALPGCRTSSTITGVRRSHLYYSLLRSLGRAQSNSSPVTNEQHEDGSADCASKQDLSQLRRSRHRAPGLAI